MGAYWFRRGIVNVESTPSVDQVLVKQLVENINAEANSDANVYDAKPFAMAKTYARDLVAQARSQFSGFDAAAAAA